ncbi:MAG: MFS transporter [Pseudolabrys sp.]|jgi:MFS family permease|nr:MFS transporter [Pseudolabrys sp.]
MNVQAGAKPGDIESSYAWLRLALAVTLSTVGGVGMWSFMVALPALQTDFGVSRADASLPFTMVMFGFAGGGILMGRLADRFGIAVPLGIGTLAVSAGYLATGWAPNLWQVSLAHALIGLGCSASFGPLMADISHWFVQRRGIAVAIAASGNYIAGTIWPPVVQHFIATFGWRATHIGIGIFCFVAMLPLVFALRRRLDIYRTETEEEAAARLAEVPFSPLTLQVLLCIAGVACCVAMSMPQVHIVAYCGDLGYGVARGAEMLSLMLGFGIVSRVGSGFIADRIGGVRTLLLGSVLQGVALFLYLWFDGLLSLYVISALFGLFQGGIVPSYAMIVREYFSPREAATRLGLVLMATLLGMALGGWLSGLVFDLTGSYRAAFLNGLGWNLMNVVIMVWLLQRTRRRMAYA